MFTRSRHLSTRLLDLILGHPVVASLIETHEHQDGYEVKRTRLSLLYAPHETRVDTKWAIYSVYDLRQTSSPFSSFANFILNATRALDFFLHSKPFFDSSSLLPTLGLKFYSLFYTAPADQHNLFPFVNYRDSQHPSATSEQPSLLLYFSYTSPIQLELCSTSPSIHQPTISTSPWPPQHQHPKPPLPQPHRPPSGNATIVKTAPSSGHSRRNAPPANTECAKTARKTTPSPHPLGQQGHASEPPPSKQSTHQSGQQARFRASSLQA
jgi:hypothetical protein